MVVTVAGGTGSPKAATAFDVSAATVPETMSTVAATNGTVTITLAAAPTTAPVAGDFTATSTINSGTPTALTLGNFSYNSSTATVTYTFTPIAQTASAQSVVVTVAGGTGSPKAATAFDVAGATISSGGGGGGGSVTVYTPVVQTEAATIVSSTSIALNGDITSDSGYKVTDYGFMWGTSASSLTNKLDVGNNNQSGTFTGTLSVTSGTTYYFEAYATNSYGTADGAVISLTAGAQTPTLAVQTEAATSITATSAVLNGYVTSAIGSTSDYGFLWGTSSSSLTNTLAVGTNNESVAFTGTLSNLTAGTTYYFEAYATNSYADANGTVMSLTAGVQTTPTTTPTTTTASSFSDVSSRFWGYNIITSMSSQSIVSGYPDGTFKPNAAITRAEFAAMLVKALGLSAAGTTGTFTDVSADAWYYGSVNAAVYNGLVFGMGNNMFEPEALITRQEMAVMVAKALGAKTPAITGAELDAFNDALRVSSWAKSGMDEAVKAGIVIGMSADQLAPMAHATRAQAAAMIYHLLNFLGK